MSASCWWERTKSSTHARPTNNHPKSYIPDLKRSTCPPLPLPFPPAPSSSNLLPSVALLNCKPTFIVINVPIYTPLNLQSTREASPPNTSFPSSAPSYRFQQTNPSETANPSKSRNTSQCDPYTRPSSFWRPRPHCSPTNNPTA